jgi:hypothetical protein
MRNFKTTLKHSKHGDDFWKEVKDRSLGLLSRDDVISAGVPHPELSVTEADKQKVRRKSVKITAQAHNSTFVTVF